MCWDECILLSAEKAPGKSLIQKKKTKPRAGWKEQIQKEIDKNGLPEILIPDTIQNDFNESEWQW